MRRQIMIVSNLDNSKRYSKSAIHAGYTPMSMLAICTTGYADTKADREIIFESHAKDTTRRYDALVIDEKGAWAIPIFKRAGWGEQGHPIVGIGEEFIEGVDEMVSLEGLVCVLKKISLN